MVKYKTSFLQINVSLDPRDSDKPVNHTAIWSIFPKKIKRKKQ